MDKTEAEDQQAEAASQADMVAGLREEISELKKSLEESVAARASLRRDYEGLSERLHREINDKHDQMAKIRDLESLISRARELMEALGCAVVKAARMLPETNDIPF